MKLILFFILSINLFAQSELLLLMDDDAVPTLTELTAIEVWYKGDAGLTSSGWTDSSPNGKNLLFKAAAWTPNLTGTKNGIPTALFDGVNDKTDSVLFTTTSWTIYMVVKNGNHTNFDAFCDGGGVNAMSISQGASTGLIRVTSTNSQASANTVAVGSWAIVVGQVETTGAGQDIWIKINDNTIEGGTANGNPNASGFKLGGKYDSATHGNFEVAEVIVYDAFHDAATITSVIDYLNSKYGIY